MNILKFAVQLTLVLAVEVTIATEDDHTRPRPYSNPVTLLTEAMSLRSTEDYSWLFGFDNDALVPGSRDQDYTYGVSVSLSTCATAGARAFWKRIR